jgi:hypothetical protein
VAVNVVNKIDGFAWKLVVVYGTAYYDFNMEFIAELHYIMEASNLPTLIGGDFNLVRSSQEKSNGVVNANWTMLFNDWINRWALLDLKIVNRCFTWSNNQDNLIMSSLDRVLATTDWESCFPLNVVKALPKPVSDHTPLLIDTMSRARPIARMFRFEKWWLNYPDFYDVIRKAWSSHIRGRDSLDTS